jgi:hypothetical protein
MSGRKSGLRSRRGRRHRLGGFTLVELMVSMVGGIFVSMAVFTIAKHSSSFAMQQSRIADATLQNVVGFERLRADISRAGFLSTPNMVDDPQLCPAAAYPAWLGRLASVFIDPVPAPLSSEMTVNGLTPSRITLGGSYASSNEFIVRRIVEAAQPQVVLQPNTLGMVEMGFTADPTAETLARVFATGRALRIVDRTGRTQYGQIADVSVGAAGEPTILLTASPALTFRSSGTQGCGIDGFGVQYVANVVNIIRYDLRNLDDGALPDYAPMFLGGPTYEKNNRRELIREELDLTGTPFPGSLELVAEYAVDLGFSLLVAPTQKQPLTRILPAQVGDYAGTPGPLPTGQGPQRIRAVQVWLSTRSQEADRLLPLDIQPTAPGPDLLRVSLHPTDPTKGPFARVRTVQSMVPLNNQAMVPW